MKLSVNCSFLSSLFHCLFWHCKKKKRKNSNSKANSEFYSELQNKSLIIEYCSPVINFTTIVFLYVVVNTIPRVFSFIRSYACKYFFFCFVLFYYRTNSIDKSRRLGSIFDWNIVLAARARILCHKIYIAVETMWIQVNRWCFKDPLSREPCKYLFVIFVRKIYTRCWLKFADIFPKIQCVRFEEIELRNREFVFHGWWKKNWIIFFQWKIGPSKVYWRCLRRAR